MDTVAGVMQYIETKKVPSRAGMQIPVKREEGQWVPLQRDILTGAPWLQALVDVSNSIWKMKATELGNSNTLLPYELSGDLAKTAMKAFSEKYRSSDYPCVLVAGVNTHAVNEAGEKHTETRFVKTDPESLYQNFTPRVETRPKKSGSRPLSKKHAESLIANGFDLIEHASTGGKGSKYSFRDASDKDRAEAVLDISPAGLHVSADGTIRVTSTTNNVNALFSLDLKDNPSGTGTVSLNSMAEYLTAVAL